MPAPSVQPDVARPPRLLDGVKMPSTHLCLHYHIVFSTKHREPWISADMQARLHEYLGGVVRRIDGVAEAIGGIEDHVHILAGLNATHRLADVVREIKSA